MTGGALNRGGVMGFLQVASWNIEHLSGAPRAERRQSAFALADHIEMAGVDLMALQEIYITPDDEEVRIGPGQPPIASRALSPDPARPAWRNADLDVVCHLLEEHRQGEWRYHILPNRVAGDREQLCAAMWNNARLDLAEILPLPVAHQGGGFPLWDRAPHVLNFTSEIEVWQRSAAGEWTKSSQGRRLSLVPL